VKYKILAVTEVDAQRVQDLIVGAFEGGSNYWLGNGRVTLKKPEQSTLPEDGVVWYGNSKLNVFAQDGFEVTIQTEDGLKSLTPMTVATGLTLMAEKHPSHFADLVNENDDATTSDVFLQLCLFKEIVYG